MTIMLLRIAVSIRTTILEEVSISKYNKCVSFLKFTYPYVTKTSCISTNFVICPINYPHFTVWSWKLSRTKQLTATSVAAINSITANIDVIDNIYYEPINQDDESCFYYPVLSPGELVTLPGQCDPTITAVQNFSAARV